MGEDYYSMSREKLIEKLKSKDGQIKEMSNEIDNLRQKNNDLEKAYWDNRKETQELRNIKFENDSLKNAIVAMAMYCFPGISNIDKNIIDIKESLKNISKGR